MLSNMIFSSSNNVQNGVTVGLFLTAYAVTKDFSSSGLTWWTFMTRKEVLRIFPNPDPHGNN